MKNNFIKYASYLMPDWLRFLLNKFGFQKLLSKFINKTQGELIFQYNWVQKFSPNKDKVKKYWEKYLYLEDVKKICHIGPKTRILDVGCGISTVLHFLEGERCGIDPLAVEYKKIYQYPKDIEIKNGIGEAIPYASNFFNTVFCTNVIDHTENPQQVINEVWRVLQKDGYFVMTLHVFTKKIKRDPAHPHTFTEKDILKMVQKHFKTLFQKESPAIGFYDFIVNNSKTSKDKELILVLKKMI